MKPATKAVAQRGRRRRRIELGIGRCMRQQPTCQLQLSYKLRQSSMSRPEFRANVGVGHHRARHECHGADAPSPRSRRAAGSTGSPTSSPPRVASGDCAARCAVVCRDGRVVGIGAADAGVAGASHVASGAGGDAGGSSCAAGGAEAGATAPGSAACDGGAIHEATRARAAFVSSTVLVRRLGLERTTATPIAAICTVATNIQSDQRLFFFAGGLGVAATAGSDVVFVV